MKRGNREIVRMAEEHEWEHHTCTCGEPATHVCSQENIAFAVACEWHAFQWVRNADK